MGDDRLNRFMEAFNEEAPTSIRVNPARHALADGGQDPRRRQAQREAELLEDRGDGVVVRGSGAAVIPAGTRAPAEGEKVAASGKASAAPPSAKTGAGMKCPRRSSRRPTA